MSDKAEIPTRDAANAAIAELDRKLTKDIAAAKAKLREELKAIRKADKEAVAKWNRVIVYHDALVEAMQTK